MKEKTLRVILPLFLLGIKPPWSTLFDRGKKKNTKVQRRHIEPFSYPKRFAMENACLLPSYLHRRLKKKFHPRCLNRGENDIASPPAPNYLSSIYVFFFLLHLFFTTFTLHFIFTFVFTLSLSLSLPLYHFVCVCVCVCLDFPPYIYIYYKSNQKTFNWDT